MSRHLFLADAQREAIETAHFQLDDREIARHWTLSEQDLLRIDRRRRDSNRFGFAVQLCLLRFPGWPPNRRDRVPLELLRYVAEQLEISEENLEEYFLRQPTRSEHLQEIMDLYGFRYYDTRAGEEIATWIKAQAHHWHTPAGLLLALLDELRRKRVILPSMSLLEHTAWHGHRQVEQAALGKLSDSLRPSQRSDLDDLLMPAIDSADRTLTWLRRPIAPAGAKGMLDLMDRLELFRKIELSPASAEGISPLLLRQLADRGGRHTLQHLRDYDARKRFGVLAAFLLHSAPNLTDELTDMFIRLVGRWFNKADKRRWDVFQSNGRSINQRLHDFIVLGRGLIAAQEKHLDLHAAIESTFGWEELASVIGETEKLAAPLDFSNLDELSSQYSQARQYAPRFLAELQFEAIPRRQSLLKAVATLRKLNETQSSAVPKDAPREFVPRRWRPYVFDGEKIDRAYYELCVLSELSIALRSGDIWVPGSRRYLPLDHYLVSQEAWKVMQLTRNLTTSSQYLDERKPQLNDSLQKVSQLLSEGQLPDVSMEDGTLSISPLKADVPAEVDLWSDRIYDVLPRIYLTDLLMEVDSWTDISKHFTHLYTQQPAADRTMVFSVILSDATNIGLTKIADATPGRSYARLSWMADWYVREENYAKALAEIVRKQHQVPLASRWGPGTTSSSDGQAFPIGNRKPVLAHTNAKYSRDPVVMLYSHISDRYAPFYTKVIRSTVRDATHVLDGLLDHGTEIHIEEHYTDTGGVSEQVFALCFLLGFRFAPRIRDLPDRRLFTLSNPKQYLLLKDLIADKANIALIERNWDELLRLAGSIRDGKVSSSLLVSKLAAYPHHSELALALRELGRIERTLFTLDWLQKPELRRRAQIGLNKGELRNSLARALRFYRRGAIADRDREEQQRKASGLNLAIAAISLWNTVYVQKAIRVLADAGNPVPDDVIPHLSPLGWEHITFTGSYYWRKHASDINVLRPLRTFKLASKVKTA
jgi:TnpA family transposase